VGNLTRIYLQRRSRAGGTAKRKSVGGGLQVDQDTGKREKEAKKNLKGWGHFATVNTGMNQREGGKKWMIANRRGGG